MADAAQSPGLASDNASSLEIAWPIQLAPPKEAVLAAPTVWVPSFNPWLIAVIVALAAFMEVLDTSIANVALPYIAGTWA